MATPRDADTTTTATHGADPETVTELDHDAPRVPDSPEGLGPHPTWQPEQYEPSIFASGAEKLADSAVAPLVAVARGYRTVTSETVKGAVVDYGFGDVNSREGRQVRRIVGSSDAMFMQWYRTDDVVTAHRARERARARGIDTPVSPRSASLQLRPNPANARVNDRGKPVKYELVTGSVSSIGVHPAMPESWISDPARVFITEGALKGDSALTGLLRHHGISEDKLAVADPDTARDLLTGVLESFEPEDRVLVLSLVGVGNWHHNPDWNMLDVRGKDVLVAFDGDVRENIDVWRQADKLWPFLGTGKSGHGGKGGNVMLVDIPTEVGGRDKPGVDDYLAATGKWADLVAASTPDLPARPAADDQARPGDLRVDDETCTVQKLTEVTDDFGTPQGVTWKSEYDLAGRILEYGSTRFPTDAETRTGVLGAGTDGVKGNVVERTSAAVQVSWREPDAAPDSDPQIAVATGTVDMLADDPNQWHRRGHVVPGELAAHPSWPPKPDWLKAIKGHRRDDIDHKVAWERMGWVPAADGGSPVFIAGESVVGANGDTPDAAMSGVTDKVVSRASSFGVEVPADDDATRAAIRGVLAAYTGGAWSDKRVAAVVLAAALRPVVPLPPRLSIFLSGPPRRGKSWTASTMMAFWQAQPGAFWESLPGAASDTLPATENALSRAPIWVIDDLPPSADKRKSMSDQAKVGSLIRAVFNGAPRQKMFADGTTRPAPDPLSLLVVTSENLMTVSSEMDRVVHIPVSDGFLSPSRKPTDAIADMAEYTSLPMQVAGACARFVANQGATKGWPDALAWWRERMVEGKTVAADAIGRDDPNATRHAQTAASLALGLQVLAEVALDLDMHDVLDTIGDLFDDLHSMVRDCFTEQKNATPGARVIEAVRSVLAGGRGHLVAPGVGGPPMPGNDEMFGGQATSVNAKLGWPALSDDNDTPRPNGVPIGSLMCEDGQWFALLDYRMAFTVAQAAFPELIPHGQSATSTWNSAWGEGWASGPWKRKGAGQGRMKPYVRAHGEEGVPVPLETLLRLGDAQSDG